MHKTKETIGTENTAKNTDQDETKASFLSFFWQRLRDHPYITSPKELGRWGQKMAIFADVQYCIYADIVGGSEKVQKYADVM